MIVSSTLDVLVSPIAIARSPDALFWLPTATAPATVAAPVRLSITLPVPRAVELSPVTTLL